MHLKGIMLFFKSVNCVDAFEVKGVITLEFFNYKNVNTIDVFYNALS